MNMRQLSTRRLRLRVPLVIAAFSMLGVSSPSYSAIRSSHLSGHGFGSPLVARAATADCSAATAGQLVEQHHLNDFLLPNPVQQVLCGSFTGQGSEAMAITIAAATCWGTQRWAVFNFVGGDWQLVLDQRDFIFPLVAVGSDIRETTPVFRPGDPRCVPSGGSHARIWHWDGTRLVPGAWAQVAKGKVITQTFYSPSKNITCSIGDSSDYRGASCMSFKAPQSVKLKADGSLKVCRGRHCLGCGCAPEGIPTLAYGRQITAGRFRCLSRRSGVICTVIRSGKGFMIDSQKVRRVGL